MRIQDIPKLPPRTEVYIIGTGASLRCMPLKFFTNKVTVGLNQAWKHLRTTYSITVHPELVQEYVAKATMPRPPVEETKWVVKKKPPLERLELSDPNFYVFGTSYDVKTVKERPKDTLFLGEGVQTTAMDFAARIGASTIILVGCDAKSLGGDFHAHDQHVRWVGRKPEDQYRLYRDSTAETREVLRGMGVGVMSLSPFIGIDSGEEDYARLRKELKLESLPEPKDISPKDWKPPKRK